MKMSDVLEGYRGKWVNIALTSGQGAYLQGIIKDAGEDYIVVECEGHDPMVVNLRNVTYIYTLKVKENGRPKLFS